MLSGITISHSKRRIKVSFTLSRMSVKGWHSHLASVAYLLKDDFHKSVNCQGTLWLQQSRNETKSKMRSSSHWKSNWRFAVLNIDHLRLKVFYACPTGFACCFQYSIVVLPGQSVFCLTHSLDESHTVVAQIDTQPLFVWPQSGVNS